MHAKQWRYEYLKILVDSPVEPTLQKGLFAVNVSAIANVYDFQNLARHRKNQDNCCNSAPTAIDRIVLHSTID